MRSGGFWQAVGWLVPSLLPASGFWGSVGVGALASGAGQITANALNPCVKWYESVPETMITGGVIGGLAGGAGWWIRVQLGWWGPTAADGGAAAAQQVITRGGAEPVRIGQAGVQHVVNLLRQAGEPIIRQQAYYRTPMGQAFIDIETQNFLIEVKNLASPSMSQTFAEQAEKYWWISQQIGKPLQYYFTNQPPNESMIRFLEELKIAWFHTPIP